MLNKLLRLLFYWPIRLTTSCEPIPFEPLKHLKIDKSKPIAYLTVSSSVANLLTIERLTNKLGLPSPFAPLIIADEEYTRTGYLRRPAFFSKRAKKLSIKKIMQQWLEACHKHHTDIQIITITVLWSRNPSYEGLALLGIDAPTPSLRKFINLTFAGHDNCTIVSDSFSALYLEQKIAHRSEELINRALAQHFLKSARAVVGKAFPNRKILLQQLCDRPGTLKAIYSEAQKGARTVEQLQDQAFKIYKTMAADTRYPLLKFLNSIMSLAWKRIYHGQTIIGAEKVRQLARRGYEIIYIPCHRSHMDYILLSYVIFKEGLPIPQIASGDNLNFFPVGPFIRRCGSYFIRRKMKGDDFYIALFREYMSMLFEQGYATEFFIEGGRSRTGRTLPPRTGMVSMTVQAQLKGIERPIAFVPTYLGYEHVMEVNSYMQELNGAAKQKESAWQLLGIFKRFRYYGRGYVNFAKPIIVPKFLTKNVPNWREDISSDVDNKPSWLYDCVNQLASEIIINLNDGALVNGINLCALALISDEDHTMSMASLKKCLSLYLDVLQYDKRHIPQEDVEHLIIQALELKKFHTYDVGDNMIFVRPSKGQTLQLTYFQNNILHLFALPALLAAILIRNGNIHKDQVASHARKLFYFLRHELYIPIAEDRLDYLIKEYLKCYLKNGYIVEREETYYLSGDGFEEFHTLACSIKLNLARYIVAVIVLKHHSNLKLEDFEQHCLQLARSLPTEITRNSPEFADPIVFKVMIETFVRHNYFSVENGMIYANEEKIDSLLRATEPLLPAREFKILTRSEAV